VTRLIAGALLLLVTATVSAQVDDFKREGDEEARARKDPLEGKAPPALVAESWMNTDGQALTLEAQRGKVVVLDFWGTW
jgi:cytochrome oxidase Cu insertion factor (SCO1/SenC/PrrC family)